MREFSEAIANHIVGLRNLNQFKPQELSNILWAYAKIDDPSPQLFNKVADHIVGLRNLNNFIPQNMSNIVWANAKVSNSSPQLFNKVANQIVGLRNLNQFKPQELSNILWAYAKIDDPSPQLFNKVADHIMRLDDMNGFVPQALSNILWAYAKVDDPSPQLFDKVANHIVVHDNLSEYTPQNISNIVWALAKLGFFNDSLFEKIANHLCTEEHLLTTFNGQDFSMLMWAFSVANAEYPLLFEKITEQLLEFDNLNDFTTQALCNIIGGLNKFTDPPRELMNKVLETAQQRDEESGQLAMLSKALFPEESEICWTSSCTGMCGRKHISDSAVLSILLRLRFERNYKQDDDAFPDASEEQDAPLDENSIPAEPEAEEDQLDDHQLQHRIKEMKEKVDCYFQERAKVQVEARQKASGDRFSNLDDAKKAELTAQMNGVSAPERKTEKKDPTEYGFRSRLYFEWCRYKLIIPLIESQDAKKVPLFTEQCVRVLLIISPGDLHVIWKNHCATQYGRGHCNLNGGNGCREDYNMGNCMSVIAMREIARYFKELTAILFADIIEHVQCVNLFEFCTTKGNKFQRCPKGTEHETNPKVTIFNLFLRALSGLKVHTIVASSAGKTCGVEELVLNKLESPSKFTTIIRKTLRHLQFNLVPLESMPVHDWAILMTRQWKDFSAILMPALQRAGVVSAEAKTIAENLIENVNMPFVTDNPIGLEETFVKYFSKEARIDNLLECCKKAYGEDGSAKVEDQVDIIQMYAQNHWLEIQERLGMEAPISWRNLTVKQILSNIGKNGWDAKMKKKGFEKVLEELSAAGSKGSIVRQEQAEEKRQVLQRLAASGEPFWIRVKKGKITATEGQQLFRSYPKEAVDNFPKIQRQHGTIVALKSLSYKEIPFGNNKVLDTITYSFVHNYKSRQKLKRYNLKVPIGMLSYPDNGNVVLAWFQEK
eukprot:scaffold488_cov109-Skeletonema_dohrnii-CCMP3373.AAC.10